MASSTESVEAGSVQVAVQEIITGVIKMSACTSTGIGSTLHLCTQPAKVSLAQVLVLQVLVLKVLLLALQVLVLQVQELEVMLPTSAAREWYYESRVSGGSGGGGTWRGVAGSEKPPVYTDSTTRYTRQIVW